MHPESTPAAPRSHKKAQMFAMRAQGMSYQAISLVLDVDKSYVWRVCNGQDVAHPRQRRSDVLPAFAIDERPKRLAAVTLGAVSEALVCARLLTLGFDVWRPFIDRHRCDVGVVVDGALVRLQVKTAGYDAKSDRFRTALTTKDGNRLARPYGNDEFDFFIVKCVERDDCYVIPSAVGNRLGYVNLYPHRERLMATAVSLEQYRNAFALLRGGQ